MSKNLWLGELGRGRLCAGAAGVVGCGIFHPQPWGDLKGIMDVRPGLPSAGSLLFLSLAALLNLLSHLLVERLNSSWMSKHKGVPVTLQMYLFYPYC